mgnify:FL=1|jgi:hypothetical protein|tara:strand:+ start:366 stop:1019 length:654 start_codon:yes stop_codon:yes gene_type:complete
MIKLLRSKKLKRVKRVPKLKKFKFEDEQKTLNSKSNYMKFVYIIILAISFSVGNFFVINPTIQKANLIESDYNQKKNFINTSNELRASIVSKNKKVEKEFSEIQKSFFKKEEQEKFYKLFSELAMDNKLKILTLTKVNEDFYKEPKEDNPAEFNIYNQYTQVSYDVEIIGNFVDYMRFVEDLKNINKSMVTDNVQINKDGDGIIKITSKILINFKNS